MAAKLAQSPPESYGIGACQDRAVPLNCAPTNGGKRAMALRTRLTERLGIEHPVISAPMGFYAGGRLAAAVSNAGGLGLIGGGYGDGEWLAHEFDAAGNRPGGGGFLTGAAAQERGI